MKNAAVGASVTIAMALTLAACGQEQPSDDAQTEATAPQLVEGVTIENPRMLLAPVSGNPAAVYFDLTYVGDSPVTLDSVTVEGSQSAMVHQMGEDGNGGMMMASGPVTLTSGETLNFEPGGYHVMAMQMSPEVEAGQTASVTITLSDGQSHTFDAPVNAAGDER